MEGWTVMRLQNRILLAAAAFGLVAWLPYLAGMGATGASTDLGLGRLLGRGSALAFAAALGGGVLTSLTPCVYPLVPITVSIFGARSAASRRQAVVLSGLYVLGIAAMYSALGVGAALTGRAFGTALANPWVVGSVALLLAAMAASMFGAFEIRLPQALQARLGTVGGPGYAGAFAMGLVAGVIAAPCTGPVLAAALAFVAAQGSVPFGAGIMFVYALGIGLPFFLIGAFSVSLPKGGPWMEAVIGLFGVALLAAAALFAKDLVPGLKTLFSAARWAPLAAAAAAGLGVLGGALHLSFGGGAGERLRKTAGVALAVLGVVYAVGSGRAADEAALSRGVLWLGSEQKALARARDEGRPVIVDFWADWCAACLELDKAAWSDPRVQAEARRFVLLKADGSATSDMNLSGEFDRLYEKYAVVGMPTVLFIDARGRELPARILGAISAEEMLRWMRGVDEACAPMIACVARW
jgi:thiol:disulfide interchange protein DsbD